jgi:2-polyprenyl-3-methyl-5-hydroxy-6-metoxy-1,4-benzoquinol methylase
MKFDKNMDCLLCGKCSELLDPHYPGYQEPEHYSIYYCPSCNTQFSHPRVATKHIYEHIYKYADKLPWYKRYVKYANAVKIHKNPLLYLSESEEMYWAIKHTLEQETKPKESLKIIEIGCGLGYLTYSLVQDGYSAIGLDISQNAIDGAIENFGNHYICADVLEYAAQHRGAYDIVILTEVIEHIENPINFLKHAMLLIDSKTNDSKILLTTPNKTIYERNVIWRTDLPPVHLWWFSEYSMKYIADCLNMDIQFVDFTNYYKKNIAFLDIKKQRISRQHVFDKKGGVVKQSNDNLAKKCINAKKCIKKLRSFVAKLPYIKYIYHKMIKRHYSCEKSGLVLGIILKNKTERNRRF